MLLGGGYPGKKIGPSGPRTLLVFSRPVRVRYLLEVTILIAESAGRTYTRCVHRDAFSTIAERFLLQSTNLEPTRG